MVDFQQRPKSAMPEEEKTRYDQAPHEVIMVRPANFAFDPDTASTNFFQEKPDMSTQQLKEK